MDSTVLLMVSAVMVFMALGGALGLLLVLMSVPAKWSQRQAARHHPALPPGKV